MGYHPKQLPPKFTKGSGFGAGYDVRVTVLQDSKTEHRSLRSPPAGQRRYNLGRGLSGLDDLFVLYEFFLARNGSLNSFRLKDWLDYATTTYGTTHRPDDDPIAHDDEDMVLIDATLRQYQCVRRYERGEANEVTRTIQKLVQGQVKVGDSTGLLSSGFTIDHETGIITFDATPTGTPTWGGEYDTPARFTEETAQLFQVAIEAMDAGAAEDIGCIEDPNPTAVPQDRPPGGATNHGDPAANITWSPLNGLFQRFEPTTTGKKILLPDETGMPLGRLAIFENAGTQTMEIEDNEGTDVLNPFSTGTVIELFCVLNASSNRIWVTR